MNPRLHFLRTALLVAALLCVNAAPALAAGGVVEIPLGGVKQLLSKGSILRISVGNPEIAEVAPVGTTGVLVKGKTIGSTTLMVWDRDGGQGTYRLEVGVDVEAAAATLKKIFPSEDITLESTGTTLVVRGVLSGLRSHTALSSWLQQYKASMGKRAGGLKIVDMTQFPSQQQVQLEVRFAEVGRRALRKLGLSLVGYYDGNAGAILGNTSDVSLPSALGTIPSALPQPINGTLGVLFLSDPTATFPFNAMLSVLSSRGLSKTLSEPNLVAMSGQKADFLVGGEFPMMVPLGLGQYSIEFKKFGVQLTFEPIVLRDDTIQLKVASVVSDLDYSNSISLSGTSVPSLTARSADTTVRLRSGQSFAIAGLLQDKVVSTVNKIPLLGDIPIVGMLFRSTDYQRQETELVVVVTARLVQPLDRRQLPPLPGEGELSDPNDFELFLMGWGDLERPDPRRRKARPQGRVGYRR